MPQENRLKHLPKKLPIDNCQHKNKISNAPLDNELVFVGDSRDLGFCMECYNKSKNIVRFYGEKEKEKKNGENYNSQSLNELVRILGIKDI